MKIINNIITNNEIQYLLNNNIVIENKHKLFHQNVVKFSITMPEHMITKLEKQLNITFTNKQEIPMRWIKGNSPVHIDKSKTHLFDTTHLIYVTDCVGNLVVNGEKYSITAGTAYIFEEGLEHETIGTEDSARDRKSTRLNSSHVSENRMRSSARKKRKNT